MNGKITKKQKKLVIRLVFDDSSKTTDQILADEGVTTEKYAEWLADADFIGCLVTVSRNAAEAGGARIIASLTERCRSGEASAVKAYFDILTKLKSREEARDGADADAQAEIDAMRREIWGDVSSP